MKPQPTPLVALIVTTMVVTALSYAVPATHTATAVGAAFLAATYWLVLRRDEAAIRHAGLSLGGLLEPGPLSLKRLLGSAASASGWAAVLAAIVFPPFVIGYRLFWHVHGNFHLSLPPDLGNEILGQILVVGLPEEAFYRGYLTTALDDAWGTPWTIAKAKLGWGWIATSAAFAIGHLLTDPNPARLGVFFPALLFGWMRARTKGVGGPALLHAMCNLLSSALARGYVLGTG
jgi:uncharacterized protein